MRKLIWLALLLPLFAHAASQGENQLYVVCSASLGYQSEFESGERKALMLTLASFYFAKVDTKFQPTIEALLRQFALGVSVSDVPGTVSTCIRWVNTGQVK